MCCYLEPTSRLDFIKKAVTLPKLVSDQDTKKLIKLRIFLVMRMRIETKAGERQSNQ